MRTRSPSTSSVMGSRSHSRHDGRPSAEHERSRRPRRRRHGVGVLMGLSVRNLLTGEETVIFSKPLAERQELPTCTYTWPFAPPFLLFTAQVLFTPRT